MFVKQSPSAIIFPESPNAPRKPNVMPDGFSYNKNDTALKYRSPNAIIAPLKSSVVSQ